MGRRAPRRNIIHFYGTWKVDKDEGDVVINFITELCTNNLRECAPSLQPPPPERPPLTPPLQLHQSP